MSRFLPNPRRRQLPALLATWAAAGTLCAAELPSALDAAGQLKPLAVQATADFAWTRVAGGVQFQVNGITKSVLF